MLKRPRIVFNFPSEEDSLSPAEKRYKEELWKKRVKRLESGDDSDCKIIVGDQTILTHKFVLTNFPYFKAKFNSQSNFHKDERNKIEILRYEHAIVSEMLKYMCTH